VVTYQHNAVGRIDSVTSTVDGVSTVLACGIEYLPFGPIRGLVYDNGLTI
jgi:hypothetical protein